MLSWTGERIRAWAALSRGLDGTLLATSAQPVGQAMRGFVVELLAQRQAATEQQAASMRCYMARGGDAMAHDGRRTGGH
jgi:hypothetical protein